MIPGSAAAQFFAAGASAGGGGGAYEISRSLRFNSSDSAYLSRTPASAGNRKTWTWAGWVKRCKPGQYDGILEGGTSNPTFVLAFRASDDLVVSQNAGTSAGWTTSAVFRDTSAWYHIVVVVDTTSATGTITNTSTDRIRLYVNGVQQTLSGGSVPAQNSDLQVNNTVAHSLGRNSITPAYSNCYLADVHFIDGQALDPTSFTEVDATTGQLVPIAYTGTFGTNGFHLPFSDNSTAAALGTDTSGNSPANNWTPNNFSVLNGGATTVTTPATNSPPTIDFLVIGGGGGGTGGAFSGGGGAGGYRTSVGTSGGGASAESPVTVTAATAYSVIVGAGGALSANGSNSVFGPITSLGGGRGGGSVSSQVGGSGGGGGPLTISPAGSAGTANQGFAGADGNATNNATPGGGGAGGAGSAASGSTGGAGGAGITSSITGTAVTRAAGGRGGDQNSNGVAGAPNTGNGAQGHWNGTGAVGGSGIVILRYANTYGDLTVGSGLTYTYANSGGYKIYSFTASTTFAEGAGNDSLVDTPTNYGTDTGAGGEVRGNYCTWNPLNKHANAALSLSNGNLNFSNTTSTNYGVLSTIGVTSGKFYIEHLQATGASDALVTGFIRSSYNAVTNESFPTDSSFFGYTYAGRKWSFTVQSNGNPTLIVGTDILCFAIDLDAGKAWAGKNGVWFSSGDPSTGANPYWTFTPNTAYTFATVIYNATGSTNWGARPFAYTAPSGFKALCTTNLPDPVVAKPSTVMDVKLWTGNGSTQTISGLGFSPDLVWIKSRSIVASHVLYDAVRGATKQLFSNLTAAEATEATSLTAFNSDGFSLGSYANVNESAATFVGWTWDAGSSTVTNTDGSITSQVRANASAGFSIVSYVGTQAAATVGHGLGVAPSFIIAKCRGTGDSEWAVYHKSLASGDILRLNNTVAAVSSTNTWDSTAGAPTSTVFRVNNSTWSNASGQNMIAYCFAPVAGYSSFGSYTGNGSTDGPFVFCGFRPRFLLAKSTGSGGWVIYDAARDTYNFARYELYPHTSGAEVTNDASYSFDFLSNGFKVRRAGDSSLNTNGQSVIYAAFAESPFKYARAR